MNHSLKTKTTFTKWAVFSLFTAFAIFSFTGCDEEPLEGDGTLSVNLAHRAGSNLLQGNASLFANNITDLNYRVEKLTYYLSDFKLKKDNGEEVSLSTIALIDAVAGTVMLESDLSPQSTMAIAFNGIPSGTYTGISFRFGIQDAENQEGALPNLTEHINMIWPEPIGGGYHFMKFEGQYDDGQGGEQGFAVHTGRLTNSVDDVSYDIPFSMDFSQPLNIGEGQSPSITLAYDADKWFGSPNSNIINQYPRMIMGIHEAQELYRANANNLITLVSGL